MNLKIGKLINGGETHLLNQFYNDELYGFDTKHYAYCNANKKVYVLDAEVKAENITCDKCRRKYLKLIKMGLIKE